MIRKVKREWSKKEKAFHTVDAWGDKKLPEINCAIKQMDRDALKVGFSRAEGAFRNYR